MALTFLPHQTSFGTEYGTHLTYPVAGFAESLCPACRGEDEPSHPRAAIWGQKGKVERYYWREIFRTYLSSVEQWMIESEITVTDIVEFEAHHPRQSKRLKAAARKIWQTRHKNNPKYDLSESTEASFLAEITVPETDLRADYTQLERGSQRIGKWLADSGQYVSAEELARQHYKKQGYDVWECERRLISVLTGIFLQPVIQDPQDPRVRLVMRGSTRGWSTASPSTPIIQFLLPEDFGTAEYFQRRQVALNSAIENLRETTNLATRLEELLLPSTSLRDYLWVNEDDAIQLARAALRIIPPDTILACISWVIRDFWHRQPGWPDLLLLKPNRYRFVEVKSSHDKLSLEQMQWFRWAITEAKIPAEICRIRRSRSSPR